jgi:hypothetical protein
MFTTIPIVAELRMQDHPGATEIANGIDDNCNGIIDDVVCPFKFIGN